MFDVTMVVVGGYPETLNKYAVTRTQDLRKMDRSNEMQTILKENKILLINDTLNKSRMFIMQLKTCMALK